MIPGLTIRPARPSDATAMVQVRRASIVSKALGSYEQATVDAWVADSAPERAVRYTRDIADPECIVLVAEATDEVIGFAMAAPAKGELRALYVRSNRIGRVGRALLSELEKRAFETTEVLTCLAALNAVEFYESNGYVRVGSAPYIDSRGAEVPCLLMQKRRVLMSPQHDNED